MSLARVLVVLALAAGGCGQLAAAARADGDPGSDVLVYQPLFLASDSGITVGEQVQLGSLLHAASSAGFPVRVAIIATPADLGAVTQLWRQPRAYAHFLGVELSLAYHGRLIVVMPSGVGFNWAGHSSASGYRVLDHINPSGVGAHLAAAAAEAVTALAAARGVHLEAAGSPPATGPTGNGGSSARASGTVRSAPGSTRVLAFVFLAALAAAVLGARFVYARHRSAFGRAATRAGEVMLGHRGRWFLAGLGGALVLVVALLYALPPGQSTSTADTVGFNPVLDPGTALNHPAPDFSLTDQFGRRVSVRSFRGKVVILGFNDSECTTMCPLTTTAMLDAKAMLGPAGSRVQLLGVDANPKATSIEDVLSYSEVHGMLHSWDFLTGSLRQLKRVWKEYSIGTQITHNLVDHTPAIFMIDTHGRLARLFLTQQSYAAVGQLGQLIATQASRLLPGQPPVHSHLSYRQIAGTSPTTATTLPTAGAGPVALGPGRARMVLFFATWDRQITGLSGGLERLKRYQSMAVRDGLPRLTAIDEGSVEPPGALTPFLHGLPSRLNYPVGIDTTGRVADGYEVNGQPWLMVLNSAGRIAWYYSVAALGWPTPARLAHIAREALARLPARPAERLAASPAALAALHRQASQLIGGYAGLTQRIRALRGYPIVLNVWASWCVPCRTEFSLFAAASAHFGHQVAFLGANANDSAGDASAFLRQHPVSYPSYSVSTGQLTPLALVEGLPTTIFISPQGKVVQVHTGQYDSQGILDSDVRDYAQARG